MLQAVSLANSWKCAPFMSQQRFVKFLQDKALEYLYIDHPYHFLAFQPMHKAYSSKLKNIHNGAAKKVLCKLTVDITPLSLTLHAVNGQFIHQPKKIDNYLNGYSSNTRPTKRTKNCSPSSHIITCLCQFLGQHSKIWGSQNNFWTFFYI